MKVSVIGAGSWGTALAQTLACAGLEVMMWARSEEVCTGINEAHRNPRYLSGAVLSDSVRACSSYSDAVADADAIAVVTPSAVMRQIARDLAPFVGSKTPVVICFKGVEADTGLLPVEVFEEVMGGASRLAVLSGPNHAEEVVYGQPSATVIASSDPDTARFFQELFSTDSFRTYASDDVRGAELCAAFKNVIAIAVGASYGLGYGDNTAAMIMTRGLAEMSKLVSACGGSPMTCLGLAGAGDLIVTCTSEHSRNRSFGYKMAQGMTLDEYREQTHMVVEGALACRTLDLLARRYDVELPITQMVRSVLWEGGDLKQAAAEMFDRPLKAEF